MARHVIPRVIDDRLLSPKSANASFTPIQVGSENWYAWLNEPDPRSFAFSSPKGTLTARREERHSTWYWYAYRSRGGHLHKVYLGKSEELTLVRLHEAATLLSAERATSLRTPATLSSPQPPIATPSLSAISMPSLYLLTTKISVPPLRLKQLQPIAIPEFHSRASRWYEQHKLFDEAVTHALAIPDIDRAALLIEQYARFTNFPSQFQILLGWLNRLPDALVSTHPSLSIMHAITLMLTHQLEKSSARLLDAERCLEMEMPAEQRRTIVGQLAAFRSQLARLLGDYEQCVPLARQALEVLPETKEMSLTLMLRASALGTAANAYLVDGDMTPATEHFVETTLASVRALGNLPTTMRSVSNLARLQLLQGRLRQATFTIEQAVQLAQGHGGLQALINGADYYFILGDLLREYNQLDSAEQQLVQGMGLVKETATADAEMITRGYMTLARLQQARGQSTRVRETLDAFALVSRQRGYAPALVAHGVAVRAQVELAQGNLAAAIRWKEASGLCAQDELSYSREREYLTFARVLIAQGREQPTGPFLSEALMLLERLLKDAEVKMRMRSVLEIFILRTLALHEQGNHKGALAALVRALLLAEPEGYIRLFLDEGAPMVPLLRQAYANGVVSGYVTALLEAYGEPIAANTHLHTPPSSPLVEQLTEREREVLQLLVDGESNREIAQRLVLSVNTVKKHVFNICGKLGVQSRAQAVAKARILNLLTRVGEKM
jgi:LuxR family maltose regulon positive regulatory protein